MPTPQTQIVDTDAGQAPDYTSLSAWEAQNRDLITEDVVLTVSTRATAGAADTTAVVMAGWTTDATRYVQLDGSAQPHTGKWTTTVYRLETSGVSLNLSIDFVKLLMVQLANSVTASTILSINGATVNGNFEVDRVLIRNTSGAPTSTQRGIFCGWAADTATGIRIRNTIIWDCYAGVYQARSRRANVHNVTVHNCVNGFENGTTSSLYRLKNCLAQDCTDGFNAGTGGWHADSTNNASDIASDAPGSNPQTGSVVFVDEAGDDFHLGSTDTVAKNNGADLSADADYPVTIDIDGTSRPQGGAFDIGADELVEAAASEGRLTALQGDLIYDPKTGRLVAAQGDLVYDPKTGRLTAAQGDLVYDPKSGRLTTLQGDLIYDPKTGRLVAAQGDLVYDPKTGRVTAAQGDLVYDPKTLRLTSLQADLVFSVKTARVTGLQGDIEYSVYGSRVTAAQGDLIYDPKTGRVVAVQGDIVFDVKTVRVTALQGDIVYTIAGAAKPTRLKGQKRPYPIVGSPRVSRTPPKVRWN